MLAGFSKENFQDGRDLTRNIQSDENQGPTMKITQQNCHLELKGR